MRLRDGFKTLVTFSLNPNFYAEIEITPPGIDGRGAIDQTTMRNSVWVTRLAKALKDLTEMQAVIAWDPAIYGAVGLAVIQLNQQFALRFSDTSQLLFWAEMDKFQPNAVKEGERPTANLTIIPTNVNSLCQEAGPVYIPPSVTPGC